MRRVLVYRHELFKLSETFIAQQAQALQRYRPIYVGERAVGPAPLGSDVRTPPADSFSGPRRWPYNWGRRFSAYAPLVRKEEPALVHAHFGPDALYALPWARRNAWPFIVTFHGFDASLHRSALLRSMNPKWIQLALKRRELATSATKVLAVSDFVRRRLLAQGFAPETTLTHHIGVDTSTIRPTEKTPTLPEIVHVARLTEKKGTHDLLTAFALVHARVPDARLTIIGDGPLRARLEEQAKRLGIGGAASFAGAIGSHEDVLDRMRLARVVCLPSVTAKNGDSEGLPITLLESAALGRPIVATRHAGIPELVTDGREGRLVDEHDVKGLAQALEPLLVEPATAERMGRAARDRVERDFDLRKQTALLERHYDEAVESGPRTSSA